jgi:uncharacterized SAM-binding protein YcdF (DUF218 family)
VSDLTRAARRRQRQERPGELGDVGEPLGARLRETTSDDRVHRVAELWPEGRAGLVVVTGGKRAGDRFTEAEASAAYLSEHGVPADAIVLEDQGTSSYESLRGAAALLAERGLDEVLIVTDPYHALRSRLIAGEVGLDAHVSPTDSDTTLRGLARETAAVAVGRIVGFRRLSAWL